ncbi:MAG: hypothetical protein AAGG56_03025 [Pseudomonadota bacterium]
MSIFFEFRATNAVLIDKSELSEATAKSYVEIVTVEAMMAALIETFGHDAVLDAIATAGFEDLYSFFGSQNPLGADTALTDMLASLGLGGLSLPSAKTETSTGANWGIGVPDFASLDPNKNGSLFDGGPPNEGFDFSDPTGSETTKQTKGGKVTSERTEWSELGTWMEAEYEYKNGKLDKSHHKRSDGQEFTKKYYQDGNGNIGKVDIFDKDGKKIGTVDVEQHSSDYGDVTKKTYTWDGEVTKTETTVTYKDGSSLTHTYDKDGKLQSLDYRDKDGKLVERTEVEYDENGNEKEITRYDKDGNVIGDDEDDDDDDEDVEAWLTDPDGDGAPNRDKPLKDLDAKDPLEPDPETTQPDSPFGPDAGSGSDGTAPPDVDPNEGTTQPGSEDTFIFAEIPEYRLDPTYGLINPEGPDNPEGAGGHVDDVPKPDGPGTQFAVSADSALNTVFSAPDLDTFLL